jgi:hypothetical protein
VGYIIIAGLVGGYIIGLVVEDRIEEGKDTDGDLSPLRKEAGERGTI